MSATTGTIINSKHQVRWSSLCPTPPRPLGRSSQSSSRTRETLFRSALQ